MVGMIISTGFIVLLIRLWLLELNSILLGILLLILMIIMVSYMNYFTYHLRKRGREFYIRKLLGATDRQIFLQLTLESIVYTSFMIVSGMVLVEIFTPWCGNFLGLAISLPSISFFIQLVTVVGLTIPLGLIATIYPIISFVKKIKPS